MSLTYSLPMILEFSFVQRRTQCSGQVINKGKSDVLFSANASTTEREEVKQELQIVKETLNEKYLGLPAHVDRSKGDKFAYLKDRVWQRIQGWKEKMLSWAGKEVLIKAVAQAIPTFAMGCFEITKGLCDQISRMICRDWWNQQEGKHKVHWLSWEKMIKPKSEGGLGFRDIYAFNLAMLAKQGWRLVQQPDSLCSRILKAKYFPNSSCLASVPKDGISYTWRSILKGIEILKEGMVRRVGDGTGIDMWNKPWLPKEHTRKPITPKGNNLMRYVSDLVNPVTGGPGLTGQYSKGECVGVAL